jgi:hypothetical protein
MRRERRAGAPRLADRFGGDVPQVGETFARGDRHGADAARAARRSERLGKAVDPGRRLRAAIARDVVDVGAAHAQRVAQLLATAVAAKDHDALAERGGELGQRQQAVAVERRARDARIGDAQVRQRIRSAGTRRERGQTRGPAARIGRAVFRRVGRDEDRVVVRRQR